MHVDNVDSFFCTRAGRRCQEVLTCTLLPLYIIQVRQRARHAVLAVSCQVRLVFCLQEFDVFCRNAEAGPDQACDVWQVVEVLGFRGLAYLAHLTKADRSRIEPANDRRRGARPGVVMFCCPCFPVARDSVQSILAQAVMIP